MQCKGFTAINGIDREERNERKGAEGRELKGQR